MAGEWIKVERSTPDKPEVLRIARELSIDRDAVFGKLMLVWMWFDTNSVDGVVDGAVDADVDALVRHPGFASVMRSVKWLSNSPSGIGLLLPNFSRHNGETAKKRVLSNRRQSKWRNACVDGRVDAGASTNASTREEKRRIKEADPAADAALDPIWGPGLQILLTAGVPEKQARPFIGSLLGTWESSDVLAALQAASGKADPRSYVRGVLRSTPRKGEAAQLKVAMP